MPTLPLIKSNLKWNSFSHFTTPKFLLNPQFLTLNFKILLQKPPTMAIQEKGIKQNQIPLQKTFKALQKPPIMDKGVEENQIPLQKSLKDAILKGFQNLVMVMSLLVLYIPHEAALAASGGRVGGSSFSSRVSESSSSSSSSRGGGSKISVRDSRSTRDKFESSPSYRTSTGFDSYATGIGAAPSPFGLGGGGLYAAPGVGVGFGSSFFFIVASFIGFVLVSGFLSDLSAGSASDKITVVKLQVGLLGMARSLQRDLNRIAEAADTSSPEGLHFVLTETIIALLRHPHFCISAYSSVDVKRNIGEGERRFNQLSVEERGKFDAETLVNVNNIRNQTGTSRRATGFHNEYIVITILVAAEGVYKFPAINSNQDLKGALQKLASLNSSRTLAVEVLWTPQSENDTLSERDLLKDYPLLRPL